jgi:glycopeptide antibiotics resistance protein
VVATFLLPVGTALYVYPIIVLVVLLPVAFVSYRRRGRAGGWTTVVFYSFLFYLLAIVLETVIPLPANGSYCTGHNYASSPQLRPFYFVQVIEEHEHGSWGLASLLHNGALWSSALNVIMLLPLGIYLRYWQRMRLLPTTLLGFGISLFFELTQLTGLWFVYPCPYRLFSVDDMILNTTGAFVGWLIAGPLSRLLPKLEPDRDHRHYAAQVTFTRRLLALLADLVGFTVLLGFGAGLLTLFGQSRQHRGLEVLILALVWFVLVPTLTGSTLGKRVVLLRVERTSGRRAWPLAFLVRYGILLSPLWLTRLALDVDHWNIWQHPQQLLIPLGMLLSLFLVGVWSPLAVLLDDSHRAPYERITRTVNAAIVRKPQTLSQRTAALTR